MRETDDRTADIEDLLYDEDGTANNGLIKEIHDFLLRALEK